MDPDCQKGWQFCPTPLNLPLPTLSHVPPRKGGGAGMGQYFVPAPRGRVGMGLVFLSPTLPAPSPPHTNKDYNCKFSKA